MNNFPSNSKEDTFLTNLDYIQQKTKKEFRQPTIDSKPTLNNKITLTKNNSNLERDEMKIFSKGLPDIAKSQREKIKKQIVEDDERGEGRRIVSNIFI